MSDLRSNDSTSTEVALIEPPAPESNYPVAFEEFWSAYPRHEGKRKALEAWRNARRRATATEILEGARRYAQDPNRRPQFTAHPSTWLNRDGWTDEPLPDEGPRSQQDRLQQSRDETHAALARMGVA